MNVESVPLFPLPNVVLFPHTVLPLHIFEPRYRAMMRAALAGDRRIAMALLKPGYEAEYSGAPPIFPVVGVGRILQHTELPDGRYNLMLVGIGRSRIVEERGGEPFRIADVEEVPDIVDDACAEELESLRALIVRRYETILEPLLRERENLPLSILCDLLASALLEDPFERQALLETADVGDRTRRLLDFLNRRRPLEPSLN